MILYFRPTKIVAEFVVQFSDFIFHKMYLISQAEQI